MTLGPIIPIVRIFDASTARESYVEYLGFAVDLVVALLVVPPGSWDAVC